MLVARPLSMQARVGRALQRYEGGVRLTCGCVPFYEGRVVLVSSQSSGRWILPKGGWETDENADEAAAREAFEEAGVLGHIVTALPDVNYTSKGRPVRMIIFTMDVTEMLSRWPESQQRRRALFDIEEAMEKVKPEMKAAMVEMLKLQLHLPFVRNNRNPVCIAPTIPASDTEEGGIVEEAAERQYGRELEGAADSTSTN